MLSGTQYYVHISGWVAAHGLQTESACVSAVYSVTIRIARSLMQEQYIGSCAEVVNAYLD